MKFIDRIRNIMIHEYFFLIFRGDCISHGPRADPFSIYHKQVQRVYVACKQQLCDTVEIATVVRKVDCDTAMTTL